MCGSTNWHHKDTCSKRDWIMCCSNDANHFRFDGQRDWGNLYDDFVSTIVSVQFDNEEYIHVSSDFFGSKCM